MPTSWPTCSWLSPKNREGKGDPRNRSERTRCERAEMRPLEVAVRLCAMTSAAAPASIDTADSALLWSNSALPSTRRSVTLPATRMPVDARGLALGILAALASVFALSWAQAFVVPLLLGIVIAYTLNPLVEWLEAIKIPRVVGTVIVMASVIGALVLGTYSLRGQMQTIIEQLPEAATKFATGIARMRIGQIGNMRKMQNAATEVEKATTQAAGGSVAPRSACHSRHRGQAHVQARQLPVGEFDGRPRSHGPGGNGRFPDFLSAARWRYIQTQAGAADGAVAVEKKDYCPHSRRHQRFDPEIHAHAADDKPAGRVAQLDRVSAGSASRTRELGPSLQDCCTSSPTWAPASRPSQREWPPSCSSSRLQWHYWLPAHRWRSLPSSERS